MSDLPPPSDWAPRPADSPPPFNPAPNSGFNPPPPPPPSSSSGCGKMLIVIMVVMLLGGLLFGGCVFFLVRSVTPVVDEANEFMADLAQDDVAAALEHVSTDQRCFGESAAEDLTELNRQFDVVSYNLTGGSMQSNQTGPSTGDASGTAELASGSSTSVTVSMIKEGDDWLVCGIIYR